MSVQDLAREIKGVVWHEGVLLSTLLVLVAFGAFVVGRMSASVPVAPVTVSAGSQLAAPYAVPSNEVVEPPSKIVEVEGPQVFGDAPESGQGAYVGSKNGTKYHLPWCPGARTIKAENKVWFNSKAEAEVAGYQPAANCKGI